MTQTSNAIALGRAGYEAYGEWTRWKNYRGEPMPRWEDVGQPVQDAWTAAAASIARMLLPRGRSGMAQAVVTVAATIMDGTVVRWHRTVGAAETHQATLSASRYGVAVHADYLTDVPPEWITAATRAYETLRRSPRADVRHLATHRHSVVANGPLVPVEAQEGSSDG